MQPLVCKYKSILRTRIFSFDVQIAAAKYKEYNKLQRPELRKEQQHQKTQLDLQPQSDTHPDDKGPTLSTRTETHSKHVSQGQQPAATPQKKRSGFSVPPPPLVQLLADEEEDEEPDIEPTPAAIRMQLGPTPQKDGHILSLFDSLSSVTPSKSRSALANIQPNNNATPSKRQTTIAQSPAAEHARGSRTPTSSGKRFMLDTFATPLKRKREDEDQAHGTPSSSMKLLATPAFLRRSNTMSIMDTLAEEAEQDGDMPGLTRTRGPPFKKKRGFIRSLSSIIQGMRKQEDDALDEQMDIMREMEDMDDMGNIDQEERQTVAPPPSKPITTPEPEVLVEDSQIVMPLGPDRTYESEESDEDDPHGPPRKAWKKKGLKRQTKRVMSMSSVPTPTLLQANNTTVRPVTHKSKKPDTPTEPDTDNEADLEPEAVAETQMNDAVVPHLGNVDDDDSESDYSDSEAKLRRTDSKTTSQPVKAPAPEQSAKEDGPVKRAARKISAGAHANFRKLKIKNQNTKANGRGRFGRR